MSYTLQFKPAVEKDFKSLPKTTILRVFKQILRLQNDPFPPQSNKLSGMTHFYRIRVGDYRIVYDVDEKTEIVVIHYVRHRRDVYRQM